MIGNCATISLPGLVVAVTTPTPSPNSVRLNVSVTREKRPFTVAGLDMFPARSIAQTLRVLVPAGKVTPGMLNVYLFVDTLYVLVTNGPVPAPLPFTY